MNYLFFLQEQDIINAISLIKVARQHLQVMREKGWESHLDGVYEFCNKNGILIWNMDDIYVSQDRSRCKSPQITNSYHYHIELFYIFIDMQLLELNNHFSEINIELLFYIAYLNLVNSFYYFDKQKLIRLAQFYLDEFSHVDLLALEHQLEDFIIDICPDERFYELKGLDDFSKKLVETKKYIIYP